MQAGLGQRLLFSSAFVFEMSRLFFILLEA
jgi:hypothetical protein